MYMDRDMDRVIDRDIYRAKDRDTDSDRDLNGRRVGQIKKLILQDE
jgi:hypothetical protein